jgi:hypothetical protein
MTMMLRPLHSHESTTLQRLCSPALVFAMSHLLMLMLSIVLALVLTAIALL